MVLPTVFLGLDALFVAVLVPGVLEASLEGVGLPSCGLERVGVFVSTALLVGGFLEATSDFILGVSGLADFVVDEGRVRGDSAGFLAAGVAGLVTSFFKGVVFLDCDAGGLPLEGVVVVDLGVAVLTKVEAVLGVAGLDVAVEFLAVLADCDDPVAGRDAAAVPTMGLLVLESGALSVLDEAAELVLVGAAAAGLEAGGFFATVVVAVLDLTPLGALVGVFLAAGAPVVNFALLLAGRVPEAFFSPTLVVALEAGAPAVPGGFLVEAEVGVAFFSAVGAAFLATPLV